MLTCGALRQLADALLKQAVTAAGFGCMAALEVEKWLMNQSASGSAS